MKLFLLLALSAALATAAEMVRIPQGSFEVTDQITTLKLRVTVSAFELSAAEVTQREYREVTGSNPSIYRGDERPVENVSWFDAIRFTNQKSLQQGLSPCYDLATGGRRYACTGYRLPTDAEWIRAAGPKPAARELNRIANLGDSSTTSLAIFQPALTRGTLPVKSRAPGPAGLYDMWGNVWEWCEDWYDPVLSLDAIRDPRGPLDGLMRIVHGGSFVTTTGGWSRDYRSSMEPDTRSRYTGFRLARSLPAGESAEAGREWWRAYNQAPAGYHNGIGGLSPLLENGGIEVWRKHAGVIRAKWTAILGLPAPVTTPVAARLIRQIHPRNFAGQIYQVETSPGSWEKLCVLRPRNPSGKPLPVVIVPFYDIDLPVGADSGGRRMGTASVDAFAYTAAQHGYIAVAVRWFGENDGEYYSEASANLLLNHPGITGLGKWIADSRRMIDFIETLPDVDRSRIGMFGHSLGGKMTLYAAAFDPRIRAAVSSELGVGLKMSNYEDYWYLGDRITTAPPGTDQHELIGLMAPRPFLLIGGDKYDGNESWRYINAARAVYRAYGKPENVGMFNHHTGHTPTEEAVRMAFGWLDHFLQ